MGRITPWMRTNSRPWLISIHFCPRTTRLPLREALGHGHGDIALQLVAEAAVAGAVELAAVLQARRDLLAADGQRRAAEHGRGDVHRSVLVGGGAGALLRGRALHQVDGHGVAHAVRHHVLEQRHVVAGLEDGAIAGLLARQLLGPGGIEVARLLGGRRRSRPAAQRPRAVMIRLRSHRLLLTYCSIWSVVEMALEFIS